jgi:hypothetical protein
LNCFRVMAFIFCIESSQLHVYIFVHYDVQLRSDKLSRCQFKIVCCVFTSFVEFVYPCVVSGIVSKLFLIH